MQPLSLSQTKYLARTLAKYCPSDKQLVIFLEGELGAGKTTFARAFLKGLGYIGLVKSPTYTFLETYSIADYHIFHLDLYRLEIPTEILGIGLYDAFNQTAIWLIEWPSRAISFLPPPDITCLFTLTDCLHQVQLKSHTQQGQLLLEHL